MEQEKPKNQLFASFKNFAQAQLTEKVLNPLSEKAEILKSQALEKLQEKTLKPHLLQFKTFQELVQEAGFNCESYDVKTDDGYILQMFRIRSNDVLQLQKGKAPAVLLQHGLVSSSETWILNTVDKAPAFVFANAGYDVWLGNNRGNCYSRRHETLDPEKDFKEFFDYSYTDLGRHDLPSQVTFVCEQSQRKTITYIGHSQGTSQMFFALTQKELGYYLKERINLYVALAPVTRVKDLPSKTLLMGADIQKHIETFMDKFDIYEIFGPKWNKIDSQIRQIPYVSEYLSQVSQKSMSIYNEEDRVDLDARRNIQTASRKQLCHFGQGIKYGLFQEYDYGEEKNIQMYGQKKPPEFFLSNINLVPVAMFVGKQDILATVDNAKWAYEQIQSQKFLYEIDDFDHSSFLLGKEMKFLQQVLELMIQFNPK